MVVGLNHRAQLMVAEHVAPDERDAASGERPGSDPARANGCVCHVEPELVSSPLPDTRFQQGNPCAGFCSIRATSISLWRRVTGGRTGRSARSAPRRGALASLSVVA